MALGAEAVPCPAEPPWPPEYSDAHHELKGELQRVAARMVELHDAEPTRIEEIDRKAWLMQMAGLLAREDVEKERFRPNASKRLRKLLAAKSRDERLLWAEIAVTHNVLLQDVEAKKVLRQLYNQERVEWDAIANIVPDIKNPDLECGPPKR
ncbi:hypothetical protein [Labilithrix luteola]|nr:hypothetical protein [Labilithrix luteola]